VECLWKNADQGSPEYPLPPPSLDLHTAITLNPDGSQNSELLFKTRDAAHIVKAFPNVLAQSGGEYSGAVQVSGSSVDGF